MKLQSDRILIEIFRNRFQAIADEMAVVILRTGHTVFVKETGDFGAALISESGEVFAAPVSVGVTIMVGLPMAEALRRSRLLGEDEGDVFIANDPHLTRGMATHLSDIFLWKPIFHEGKPVCYAVAFIHSSDIGGRVAGSIAPSNYEIFQEGLRIPPTKFLERGEVNREFLELFLLNVRIPEQNWGDLKALLTGLSTAERRIKDLITRYGAAAVQDRIRGVLDYAEAEARAIITRVPDGTYTFWDYMEGDQFGGGVVRIKLHLRVEGSDLHLDFSETDPQVRFAINMPTYSQRGHWMVAFGVVNWLRTTAPGITYNAGLVRPVHLHIPEGNLLNPDERAAVGVRAATMFRIADTISGALAQALPEEIPAAGSGQGSILLISTPDPATGKTRVSVVQPLAGGSGARPTKDGIDGIDFLMGYLRNIPTEVIEAEMSGVLVLGYALRQDSAGPGRWRGGTGIELELQVFPPYATITNRGMERYIFRPWGRMDGAPGEKGRTSLNPGTEREQDIGKIDVLSLEPGDVLYLATQGGGGYGNPLDRDPDRVREDVINGLVSTAQAGDVYGVIVQNGNVNEAATVRERVILRRQQLPGGAFGFGPERLAYEERWPDTLQTALNEAVAPYPVPLRSFLRDRTVRLAEARAERGEKISVRMLQELIAEVRRSLTQHRGTGGDAAQRGSC